MYESMLFPVHVTSGPDTSGPSHFRYTLLPFHITSGSRDLRSMWLPVHVSSSPSDFRATWLRPVHVTSGSRDFRVTWHTIHVTSGSDHSRFMWLPVNMTYCPRDFLSTWHPVQITSCPCDFRSVWLPVHVNPCSRDFRSTWLPVQSTFGPRDFRSTRLPVWEKSSTLCARAHICKRWSQNQLTNRLHLNLRSHTLDGYQKLHPSTNHIWSAARTPGSHGCCGMWGQSWGEQMRRVVAADMGRSHAPCTTHVSAALWMFQPILERGRMGEQK